MTIKLFPGFPLQKDFHVMRASGTQRLDYVTLDGLQIVVGVKERDMAAKGFALRVAEQPLGSLVPRLDFASDIGTHDGIVHLIENQRLPAEYLVRCLPVFLLLYRFECEGNIRCDFVEQCDGRGIEETNFAGIHCERSAQLLAHFYGARSCGAETTLKRFISPRYRMRVGCNIVTQVMCSGA